MLNIVALLGALWQNSADASAFVAALPSQAA
jgi:hypothetical protein